MKRTQPVPLRPHEYTGPRLLIDVHGDQIGDVIRQESSTPYSILNRKMVQTQTSISVLLQEYQLRTVQPTNPRDQVYSTFGLSYFIAIYASCWLYQCHDLHSVTAKTTNPPRFLTFLLSYHAPYLLRQHQHTPLPPSIHAYTHTRPRLYCTVSLFDNCNCHFQKTLRVKARQ